ncbi:hypothetical protein A5702_06455 [Mycobacterium sp. E3339]|nr:hypothetical protein A5702_06455 [Mycobacterium sp. E3339]
MPGTAPPISTTDPNSPIARENDDRTGAAAISIVLLSISFVVLFILRIVGGRAAKREELAP